MSEPRSLSPALGRSILVLSALVTAALYSLPLGRSLSYPLVLLSTLAHEMGHGTAAVLSGGHFVSFQLFADGSGVAQTASDGRLARAFVLAGGLLGPAFAALFCFVMGKRPGRARACLAILALFLALSLVFVVRNVFGWAFIAAVALLCAGIAWKGGARLCQMTVVFAGTQLALGVFARGDYLFAELAETRAGAMPSDVAQMSEALFLPYWFLGAVCGGFSLAVLIFGLAYYWRAPPKNPLKN